VLRNHNAERDQLRARIGELEAKNKQLNANINCRVEEILAQCERIGEQSERIAALEAALNAIKDCAGEDGESVFDAFTIRSVCRAALNPAGQCSGTAMGREG